MVELAYQETGKFTDSDRLCTYGFLDIDSTIFSSVLTLFRSITIILINFIGFHKIVEKVNIVPLW